jgi:beta-phosphoglucomutase-like phosphatase (HAD superfamily)
MNIKNKIAKDTILFFDMDGTLIDTNLANFLSYAKAVQSVIKTEIDFTCSQEQRFNRTFLKETVPDLTENEYENIIQEKERLYEEFLSETKLINPVVNILFKYSKTNKTVLVTSCRENRVMKTLKYHGLTDKFSNLFCRQHSENRIRVNKYSNAIEKLNIKPQSIIVFENEKTEVKDAIKAGIPPHNIIEFINFLNHK